MAPTPVFRRPGGHPILAALATLVLMALVTMASAQEYRVQPGDTLRVEVLQDDTLNRDLLVAPDGRISVPLAGQVRVGGTALGEIERRVAAALAPNFATAPNVHVSLSRRADPRPVRAPEPETLRIYVMGEVNRPGLVDGAGGVTLLQAMALAGGVTDFAATRRIQLRRGAEVYGFNYDQVLAGAPGIGLTPLLDGDVIVVPARRLFE